MFKFAPMSRESYKHIEEMRKALMEAYNEVYRHCWTQQEAWRRTVRHPAPRFYISPKQARLVVAPMLRGDFSVLEGMMPTRQRMYRCIYDRVLKAAQKPEFVGKSLNFIIPHIVCQPAPEFFIGPESMRKTFRFLRKGIYQLPD